MNPVVMGWMPPFLDGIDQVNGMSLFVIKFHRLSFV